ncbi:MAG TPA: hypothetical protein VMG08_21665 [Allosphingosinicella sp.]|nr:hypothetical protein [Allosphingosinicella sp.]
MFFRMLAVLAGLVGAPFSAALAQAPTRAPVRPAMPAMAPLDPAICADPERRARLLADTESENERIMARAGVSAAYSEALITWRNAQLVRSGRWTEAERMAFTRGLRDDPGIRRSVEAASTAMGEIAQALAPFVRDASPEAACRAIVALRDFDIRMETLDDGQWRAIDAAYAAEARRLGVTLD